MGWSGSVYNLDDDISDFDDVLKVDNSGSGLDSTLRSIIDNDGTDLPKVHKDLFSP